HCPWVRIPHSPQSESPRHRRGLSKQGWALPSLLNTYSPCGLSVAGIRRPNRGSWPLALGCCHLLYRQPLISLESPDLGSLPGPRVLLWPGYRVQDREPLIGSGLGVVLIPAALQHEAGTLQACLPQLGREVGIGQPSRSSNP